MTKPSARDIAKFMLERLNDSTILYQNEIVHDIQERYGDEFVYTNENGNLAINRRVLVEFQKLTENKVVWSRRKRLWRFREDFDSPESRMTE